MHPLACAILALLLLAADSAPTPQPLRKHWLVTGQVQGVGFRAFTHQAARDLKLKGWVRNLTDGRVEIVADGPGKSVTALLDRVKKGPVGARVKDVADAKVDEIEKLPPDFEIRDTSAPPRP
jgi:acylphosphatase